MLDAVALSGDRTPEKDGHREHYFSAQTVSQGSRYRKRDLLLGECEQIIFSVKKSVEDLGAEVTDQEKADIEAKTKDLEDALAGNDLATIKERKEELLKASQNVAMRAYQKAQQANNGGNNNGGAVNPDDIVDAE